MNKTGQFDDDTQSELERLLSPATYSVVLIDDDKNTEHSCLLRKKLFAEGYSSIRTYSLSNFNHLTRFSRETAERNLTLMLKDSVLREQPNFVFLNAEQRPGESRFIFDGIRTYLSTLPEKEKWSAYVFSGGFHSYYPILSTMMRIFRAQQFLDTVVSAIPLPEQNTQELHDVFETFQWLSVYFTNFLQNPIPHAYFYPSLQKPLEEIAADINETANRSAPPEFLVTRLRLLYCVFGVYKILFNQELNLHANNVNDKTYIGSLCYN